MQQIKKGNTQKVNEVQNQKQNQFETLRLLDEFYKKGFTGLFSVELQDEQNQKEKLQKQMVTNQCLLKFEKLSSQISEILINSKNDKSVEFSEKLQFDSLNKQDQEFKKEFKLKLDQFFELLNSTSFLEICELLKSKEKNQLQKEMVNTVVKFRKRFLPFLLNTKLVDLLSKNEKKQAKKEYQRWKQYEKSWKIELFQEYIDQFVNFDNIGSSDQSELYRILQNFQPKTCISIGMERAQDWDNYLKLEENSQILSENERVVIALEDDHDIYVRANNIINSSKHKGNQINMFLLNDNMEERISNSQKSKNSNKNEIILSSVKKNTDLIYCNRILNRLKDDQVVQLLNWSYSQLRPGGLLVMKNIYSKNKGRGAMDFFLESEVQHTNENKIRNLVTLSDFKGNNNKIQCEVDKDMEQIIININKGYEPKL